MKTAARTGVLFFLCIHGILVTYAQQDLEIDTALVRSHRIREARMYSGAFLYPTDSVPGILQSTLVFDREGRLIERSNHVVFGAYSIRFHYDGAGLLKKTDYGYPPNTNKGPDSIVHEYDPLGREVRNVSYSGNRIETIYRMSWDAKGRETVRERYRKDSILESRSVFEYSSTFPQRQTEYTTWDGVKVKAGVMITDEKGNLLAEEDWAGEALRSRKHLTYDTDGHLLRTQTTDGKGKPIGSSANTWSDGLLVSQQYLGPDGKALNAQEHEYYPDGLLKRTLLGLRPEPQSVRTGYIYDANGRLIRKSIIYHGGEILQKEWTYDESGRLIGEVEYNFKASGAMATTVYSYPEGSALPEMRKQFMEPKEPAVSEDFEYSGARFTPPPCPQRDTTTVFLKYKNGLPDAEYTSISCEEEMNAFLYTRQDMIIDVYVPPSWNITILDTLRQSGTGPVFTRELTVGVPGKYPHNQNYLKLNRTIEVHGDTIVSVTDIGPDGKVWLHCTRLDGVINGIYLSKNHVRSGNTEIIHIPYARDTLKVNRYDELGRLTETDSVRYGVKAHVLLEYSGDLLRKTSFSDVGYGEETLIHKYNEQNQLTEIRGYTRSDLTEAFFYIWENGHLREESVPNFRGQTFTRWEYDFYED